MTTPAPASDASAAHYAPYGTPEVSYDGFTTYGDYDATGFAASTGTAAFDADPLFGSLPGDGHTTGAYDTTHWQTGTGQTPHYDPYAAQHHAAYDSGVYDSTAWTVPAQATGHDVSGQWDANAWLQPEQPVADSAQQWEWGAQTFDTGAYFEASGVEGFYPLVSILFVVRDATQHHHVPLILGPYGYSTYRGS